MPTEKDSMDAQIIKGNEQIRVNQLRMKELEEVQKDFEQKARDAYNERFRLKKANEKLAENVGIVHHLSQAEKVREEATAAKKEAEEARKEATSMKEEAQKLLEEFKKEKEEHVKMMAELKEAAAAKTDKPTE